MNQEISGQGSNKPLEILIVEDNPKHLADAQRIAGTYKNVQFSYAKTLKEAEKTLQQTRYDAVVSDAFFPVDENSEPVDSVVMLAEHLVRDGIPFVINTAGNHHGSKYEDLRSKLSKIWHQENRSLNADYVSSRFGILESYPKDIDGEKDLKQWEAAFNYILLAVNAGSLEPSVFRIVQELLGIDWKGDYGNSTSAWQALLDEKNSLEEAVLNGAQRVSSHNCKDFEGYLDDQVTYYSKYTSKFQEMRWQKNKGGSVEPDTKKMFEEEKRIARDEHVKAAQFIRQTILHYK